MTSTQPSFQMDRNSTKVVRHANKSKPSSHSHLKSKESRNSSSAERREKEAASTRPPPLQKANSESRIDTGQNRRKVAEFSSSRTQNQRNNNNTASSSSASRTRKPVSADGTATRSNSGGHVRRNNNVANARNPHLKTGMVKRNGSGSNRQNSSSSKSRFDEIADKGALSSPDLKLESDGDDHYDDDSQQAIQFINVSSGDTMQQESQEQRKQRTICPQTILEQCQEREFNKVYEINLRTSQISKIQNLEKFTCLRVLDLSSNKIRTIEHLEANKELKELKLYDNGITEIANLDNSRELCTLQLQHNRIKKIGKGLSCLRKLSVLRLDSNRISKIESREMASCSQLTYLDISSNHIDNLMALNCLSSLEELHATHNQLSTIADLTRCRKLQEVDVSNNRVTDIAGLKGLPHLTVLSLSHNLFTTACLKSIGKLKSLQTLDISHNNLVDVDSIGQQFPSIEVLNVSDNKINKWSSLCCLNKCENLSELYASGNPVCEESDMEKYNYHSDLPTVITSLEILDGINVKKHTAMTAPIMRPMSAGTAISARQVQSQLMAVERELQDFDATLSARFEQTRTTFDSLPAEAPSPRPLSLSSLSMTRPSSHLSIRSVSTVGESRPTTAGESRPSSRCSSRRRIAAAQAYAATLHPK